MTNPKLSARYLLLSLLLVLTLLFVCAPSFAADIEPDRTMKDDVTPVLSGLQPVQIGGDSLLIRVRGHELPHPRAVTAPGENKLVLQWDGVRFPQRTDKRDWWDNYDWDILMLDAGKSNKWWKQYDYPLLDRINAEPVDDNSMRLTFTSSKPLVVHKIEGLPGSDSTAIMLKVYEPPKPAQAVAPVKALAKGDPMAIKSPVTLQVRDGDVKSVFRMLAEQQNINLLLDPSVPDMTVTFSFKGVPYNEAFSYLLRMTDLNYSMVGNMLIVGKMESLGKTLGKEIVRAYQLSYAVDDNGELKGDLTAALTGLIKLSTPPTLDQRNRTLYVTATAEQHEEVAMLLSKLDQPGKQIMIQARIVEVNDDGKQELEALVSAVYDQWLVNFSGSGLGVGYNSSSAGFEAGDIELPVAGRVPGSDTMWTDITMDAGLRLLSAGLRAIESNGKGKILAHPSVITLDGQEARVELTRNYKYTSGVDSNGNTTFSEVESGPKLTFTPIMGRNGIVTIKVEIETGEIVQFRNAGNGAQAPETTSRRVETIVRVRNGEPFAVGGLYQESKTKNRSRIPVLGYIPLLGDLFTTRTDNHIKSEVAMVVIPYILDIPDDDIATFDLKKSSLTH
ncbi:secretion protein [Synergistaceae bacterium OttesenSCG-928-I11]|nr:secretion protein [Synergistaceae bacterium OttesenSCG-928-I11]